MVEHWAVRDDLALMMQLGVWSRARPLDHASVVSFSASPRDDGASCNGQAAARSTHSPMTTVQGRMVHEVTKPL